MIKNKVYLGDDVITNKRAECGADKKGKVFCEHPEDNDIYGILFETSSPEMHKLNSGVKTADARLSENKGLWLSKKDFKVNTRNDDVKRKYLNLMYKNLNRKIDRIPTEISEKINSIIAATDDINSYARCIADRKSDIKRLKKEEKSLQKMKKPLPENFDLFYEKFKRSPHIKDITIENEYIIVKTNDLIYKSKDENIVPDFNIGAYYIFINTETPTIRTVNYKKQLRKGSMLHPCIKVGGDMCLGLNVRLQRDRLHAEREYIGLIHLIISFLIQPNYSTPYVDDSIFRCAQPVTFKPTSLFDYFSGNNWLINEKWDERKFLLDCIAYLKDDLSRLNKLTSNNNNYENAKARIENNIESYKSQLETLDNKQG